VPDLPTLVTLARRGLLTPGRAGATLRQVAELRRWGYGLAGELRSAAARSPRRAAVADEDGSLTYAALLAGAERLAAGLAGRYRIGPGDGVGLLCRNHRGLVTALAAVDLLGADTVLLNTSAAAAQVAEVVRALGPRLLVHDPEFAAAVPPGVASLSTGDLSTGDPAGGDLSTGDPAGGDPAAVAPARPTRPPARQGRTIVLTSGTTGTPRGARRPTPPGAGALAAVLSRLPLRVGERVHVAAPLFHTWGYAGLQLCLALRGTLVLRRHATPESALHALATARCTALLSVPVLLHRMLDRPVPPGIALRVAASSGSALPGDLATRFMDTYGDCLYNLYGSTEASWVSIATPAELRAHPDTAGRPPRGTRVAVLDAGGRAVPDGVVGRIAVANPMLFDGYVDGAGRPRTGGLLPTGDLGHRDPGGLLYVDGREDDMVVCGGENVFPSAVERVLELMPGVGEVAVAGVPDPEFGARLAAWVVPRPGAALDAEAVRAWVRDRVARFAVPREVHLVEALPRTATGKVRRRDLPG
jgi:acyl-CoA synthetase (AMP-forming)/AMP-acid ligase II